MRLTTTFIIIPLTLHGVEQHVHDIGLNFDCLPFQLRVQFFTNVYPPSTSIFFGSQEAGLENMALEVGTVQEGQIAALQGQDGKNELAFD